MKKIFVSGIGTDVGKTVASAVLTKALNADYWKPIQAGTEETDYGTIGALLPNCTIHPSKYVFQTPASPHWAAEVENTEIEVDTIQIPESENEFLIIEGAGGLHVPLNKENLIIDLIQNLNIPTVLVSRNYLGSINHTLLSIEALKSRNIPILGILFNGEENKSTESYITNYTGMKHLGRIELAEKVDQNFIEEQVKNINYEELTATL